MTFVGSVSKTRGDNASRARIQRGVLWIAAYICNASVHGMLLVCQLHSSPPRGCSGLENQHPGLCLYCMIVAWKGWETAWCVVLLQLYRTTASCPLRGIVYSMSYYACLHFNPFLNILLMLLLLMEVETSLKLCCADRSNWNNDSVRIAAQRKRHRVNSTGCSPFRGPLMSEVFQNT